MKHLTPEEKSWLACAIDGEGCIYYHDKIDKNGWRNRRVEIQVVNTDIQFVERARKLLNGIKISEQGRRSKKMVYRARIADHKQVLSILEQIKDYLIIKKNLAQNVIDFIKKTDWDKQSGEARKKRSILMKKIWQKRKSS